jgi:hypothetical protein
MLRAETATVQDICGCVTKMLAQLEYGAMTGRVASSFSGRTLPEGCVSPVVMCCQGERGLLR